MNFESLKALFLDFDGTLIDYKYTIDNSIKELTQFYMTNNDMVLQVIKDYNAINDQLWNVDFPNGKYSSEQVTIIRFSRLKEKYPSFTPDPEELNKFYTELFIKHTLVEKTTLTALKQLKLKGIRLFVLTNGIHWIQKQRLLNSGIMNLLEGFYSSESVNAPKPNPVMFYKAMNDNNLLPTQVWMVGDTPSDVFGAKAAKIPICYISNGIEFSSEIKANANHFANKFTDFAYFVLENL